MSLVACLGQNLEFAAVRREVKAGMYNLSAYLIAQLLIQIPLLLIMSLSAIGVSGYGIGNWNSDAFFVNLIVHALILFSFECVAQFFGIQFANPLLGMLNVIQFWFASFLFAGFLVPVDDTPWPLRVFTYISPLKYGTKAMIYSELQGTTWDGAVINSEDPRGFSCPADAKECFGATGDQVLRSLANVQWKHLVDRDETVNDCLYLLLIAVSFRCLYYVMAAMRCQSAQVVKDIQIDMPGTPRRKAFAGSSPRLCEEC